MSSIHMYTAGDNFRDPVPSEKQKETGDPEGFDYYLHLARDAYRTSEDYFDANIRHNTERNIANFANRHPPGSKYHSPQYKHRARGFRPKTRSVVRKNETAAAVALFSTTDVVSVSAENDTRLDQRVSADINQQLLTYRLENTIPWFQTCMGAYQDTLVAGVCISHQFWDYEEAVEQIPLRDPMTGESILTEDGEQAFEDSVTIIKDTPASELRPIENVHFSVAADWRDPINTSPFLIDMIPMTIDEVKQKSMQTGKTSIPWFELNDAQLMAGATTDYDPVRAQRENQREDSKDRRYNVTGFETVWVHRNIIKMDGIDWIYYTLGIHYRLSDPIPLTQEYPHLKPGQRPYVLGVSNIEAHKNYPESLAGLTANLQSEANDINNQRRDNVALVLNKRYLAKRNTNVDYQSLMANVPGGITLVDSLDDVKPEEPMEVTASSYQEQDRVNMDFDELAGSFSTSSVASNRQLNETVGGMNMLTNDANSITEYQLRIFVTTWVEPVLKQLIQLEQRHETDEALLSLVGDKLNLWQRYGVDQITDQLIQGSMSVEVNVGFGAINPTERVNKLVMGLNSVLQFAPTMLQRLDHEEVATEIFGALGYRGVERFFPAEPNPDQPPPQPQPNPAMEVAQFKAQADIELEKMRQQGKMMELQRTGQLQVLDMRAKSMAQREELAFKERMRQIDFKSEVMNYSLKKEESLEKIKGNLAGIAIKEKGANQRFIEEKQFALGPGGGRGL